MKDYCTRRQLTLDYHLSINSQIEVPGIFKTILSRSAVHTHKYEYVHFYLVSRISYDFYALLLIYTSSISIKLYDSMIRIYHILFVKNRKFMIYMIQI